MPVPKEIVKKMIFADAIFDIVNNVSRFFILVELLKIEYRPVEAALFASIIASSFSYLAINLVVRRIHVFSSRKKVNMRLFLFGIFNFILIIGNNCVIHFLNETNLRTL